MCFSPEADLVAGVVLLPVGVAALREVRDVREVPFAALPLLFALHQLVEALVWFGDSGDVSTCTAQAATTAYVLFALPVLPLLVPLAVLLIEPPEARLRVAPFVVLGAVVSMYMGWAVLDGPITVRAEAHALVYGVSMDDRVLWSLLYVVAVIGPSLLSGSPSIVWFGALNLVGLVVVGLLYLSAFASLWCLFAAASSVLILVHMRSLRSHPRGKQLVGAVAPRADR